MTPYRTKAGEKEQRRNETKVQREVKRSSRKVKPCRLNRLSFISVSLLVHFIFGKCNRAIPCESKSRAFLFHGFTLKYIEVVKE